MMMCFFTTLIVICLHVQVITSSEVLSLNGKWQIANSNGTCNFTGDVPGGIYTALLENNIIDDPYYRDNDVQYRWVAYENWTYTRSFQINSTDLQYEKIIFVAKGLDTFCDLNINGNKFASTDNMFVENEFDIKKLLKKGSNSITIAFYSAVTVAEYLNNQSTYRLPSICPTAYHGFCHYNFIRKLEYSFSWDWAPAFPGQGIWKDIYIKMLNTARINNISVLPRKTEVNGIAWVVDIDVFLDVPDTTVTGNMSLLVDGTSLPRHYYLVTITPNTHLLHYELQIPKEVDIRLWWPRGYGHQSMYSVEVLLQTEDSSDVSVFHKKIGFRTIELIESPVSNNQSLGDTFYFRVNGVPIFLKGANWVPPDMFLERITKVKRNRLLSSVVEANMNVLTIPGLAIYEYDEFYEMTDELGIMLIEGLMFTDAVYPTTPQFLNSVRVEVEQQVHRLRNHPSIIAWGLNDEDEILLSENWLNLTDIERYKKDYVKLFIDMLKPIVVALDRTRPAIPSSPSNGLLTKKENWIADNCQSEYYGDVHFYDYISDMWDIRSYPTPRFASEYGLISWCEYETLETVLAQSDMDFFSDMCQHRTHHPNGTEQMYDEIKVHFDLPNSANKVQKFKDMIYLSQINHAMMMRLQTEHFRRSQNDLNVDNGKGNTMGAIFWYLADVWQAPTWASIDFNLKWKLLHYYAKKFFGDIIISPYIVNDTLHIYMVNDEIPTTEYRNPLTRQLQFRPLTSEEVYNKYSHDQHEEIMKKIKQSIQGTVIMELYNWTSLMPMKSWNIPYKLNKTSGLIFKKTLDDVLSEGGCTDKKNCFLYFYLNSKSNPISTTWLPLTYFTDVQGVIPQATIKITDVSSNTKTNFNITLTTDKPAPFVWINAYNISGRFSDNGFVMKDSKIELTFAPWEPVAYDDFKNSLSIKSLMDIYH